jgi:hypothetical protein
MTTWNFSLLTMVSVTIATAAMENGNNIQTTLAEVQRRDVIYADFLQFKVIERSELECARRCVGDLSCLAFTFTPGSRACRGHTKLMGAIATISVISSPGSVVYHLVQRAPAGSVFFLFFFSQYHT